MKKLMMGVAGVAIVASASHAQAPFADVPRDHWAYDAVNTLSQRGLIIGYPDGTFGGKRAMTRYEFAVVIARMIPQLEEYIRTQVANNKGGAAPDLSNYVTKDQLAGYVTRSDFDALQRLVNEFGPELQMLQVDVAGLRRDLNDLKGRVAVVEEEVGRVQVHGELNAFSRYSNQSRRTLDNGSDILDLDGKSLNRTHNLLEASQNVYDMDLGITAKVSQSITANAVINVGNYLGGYSSGTPAGPNPNPYGAASTGSLAAEITPYKAYIEAPVTFKPLGLLNIQAGKTGIQFTPYTLKFTDPDSYTNITKSDNGDVIFTGLKGNFRIGGVGFTAYGGTHGAARLNADDGTGNFAAGSGYPLFVTANFTPRANNPYAQVPLALFSGIPAANIAITQSTGVHATVGTPFGGTLGLTFIEGASDSQPYFSQGVVSLVRRAQVYGADLALNVTKGIGFTGEFSSSNLQSEAKFKTSDSVYPRSLHNAYDGRVAFNLGGVSLNAGYRQIDPFFGAPGYWGTIGQWKNPTNVKGFIGSASYAFNKRVSLVGTFDEDRSVIRGYGAQVNAAGGSLEDSGDTKLNHYTAGLRYGLSSTNRVDLGVEQVRYKDINPALQSANGDAKETYYNIGLGSDLSKTASVKVLYQIEDFKNYFLTNGQDAHGNVVVGQMQVKF